MKFALAIWICSFTNGECSPKVNIPELFNTWNECVVEAYRLSIILPHTVDDINQYKLATKFSCKEIYLEGA